MTALATPRGEEYGAERRPRVGQPVRGLIARDGLVETLDRAVTRRVTVVSAPAGSGKTSLLRAWANGSHTTLRVVFVTVDRGERDPRQFWCLVLDAVRRARGADEAADLDGRPASAELRVAEIADRIVSEMQAEPVALVVDDLHELRSPEALAQLERLLVIMPGSARVVLSSRRDPPLRLHRLRLAGEVAEIREADLRFSEAETRELLAAAGIALSDAAAATLHQRTEGWAAGLRLAALSLAGHADPERFVTEFSGGHRAVGEYLRAEMLGRQPSEVQRMLLRTSLVDGLDGELADLLAGRSGSERILLELEDANAFVVSVDSERTRFRYHHLLGDFLRLELRRTLADEVPGLHMRAARLLADRGEIVEAVRHAQAAGDWGAAARVLADHSFALILDGKHGAIAGLLQAFPSGASGDDPELALAHAAAQLGQGRLQEAAARLEVAEAYAERAEPDRRRRLAAAIASARLALARRSGKFADVIEQATFLASPLAGETGAEIALDGDLRAFALLNLGVAELWSGRLTEAERHLCEGALLAQNIGRPHLEVVCRAHLGLPAVPRSLATARERCREAIALAERHGSLDRPAIVPALATLAQMAILTGELDEGERGLRRAWAAAAGDLEPAPGVLLRLATGMLHAARGRHQLALAEFEAADEAQSGLSGEHALGAQVSGWLAATKARLGRSEEARGALAGVPDARAGHGEIRNARAVIRLAEGDPRAALAELRDAPAGPAPALHAYARVEAHLLAGLAHLELGESRAASRALEEALAAAEADRLILPFAVTASLPLLETRMGHETAHRALLLEIVDLARGSPVAAPEGPRELSDELSPGELRVLRFLPTNLTRPEIAGELCLSIHTVNTHIRHIYSKLGARDRSAAVHHARELRLLATTRSR